MKPTKLSADFHLKHTTHPSLTVMSDGTAQLDNAEISDFAAWVRQLVEIQSHVYSLWPASPSRRPTPAKKSI